MTALRHRFSVAITAAALWLLASGAVLAQNTPHVLLSNGSRVDGTDIRARSDGTVILTTPNGQREFPRGQYVKAVAARPADFDRARQLAQQRNFDEALRVLEQVIQANRFLDWDIQARIVSAQVLSAKGDHAGAATAYERLFQASPEQRNESAVLSGYMNALLESKQVEKLNPLLDTMIAKGARADAARAYLLRGDLKMSQGQVEGAVMDYLRTALMFESERTTLPEALFKAAEGLEKLRDPRHKEYYRRVAQEFAGTPFAQRAQGKF
jgi:tetratricopeptide (TPR) repeat protein